ncbi:LysR family transcriptional regulator, hydrogen peroxide-inducible genes activator [Roseivivax halotolerans]|uniref:LysR family transcriptional regulator, hydrogen peroxide-inducible genes activator n=1 Tax=Roseivivax halotolerans TaxID=93684 RepID=A0A1I5ZML3_9RHOB|nr:hydrogen peroxide-inducible genes activator [Roseivivax halotolerans]SFQ57731.1 LysR family transcriptional regulator, hydrogen peroxide-inducible genes activator [Roseivivax halotolerans]
MRGDITLKQLIYFVALADTKHYRRAAERVGISQPSLSQQILGLEGALGLELVERGQRGAVLTPSGRTVLAQARKVLAEVEVLRGSAVDVRDGIAGTIRMGSTPTIGPYFLPRVMRRLHRDHPGLKVIVRDAPPAVLHEELIAGRHDLILTQLPVRSADIQIRRLFREPLKLAVAQDHPLAERESLTDADLAGRDILALAETYPLHDQIAALCDELGAELRQDYEGSSLDALRQMTALDMGLSFLPALYVHSEVAVEDGDVSILPFRRDRVVRSVGLAWRRRSAHGALIDAISEVARRVAREHYASVVKVE